MFAPLKVWRKWHIKTNQKTKRHAIAAAIAASGVGPLLMARGHRVETISEVPFVVDALNIEKTSTLVKTLAALGVADELRRCASSKKINSGQAKWRNRRYVHRVGPLIIHDGSDDDSKVVQAARNITGVDTANVHDLDLLQLAPGGHLGRFIIWTRGAFSSLNGVFGTYKAASAELKGYRLQRNVMTSADVSRLINSDQVQSVIRAPRDNVPKHTRKVNPYRNKNVMATLNPFYAKKTELENKARSAAQAKRAANRKAKRNSKDGKKQHKEAIERYSEFQKAQATADDRDLNNWNDELAAQELDSESD